MAINTFFNQIANSILNFQWSCGMKVSSPLGSATFDTQYRATAKFAVHLYFLVILDEEAAITDSVRLDSDTAAPGYQVNG